MWAASVSGGIRLGPFEGFGDGARLGYRGGRTISDGASPAPAIPAKYRLRQLLAPCRPGTCRKILADGIGIHSDKATDFDHRDSALPNLFSPKRHAHAGLLCDLLQCEKFHGNPLSTADYWTSVGM